MAVHKRLRYTATHLGTAWWSSRANVFGVAAINYGAGGPILRRDARVIPYRVRSASLIVRHGNAHHYLSTARGSRVEANIENCKGGTGIGCTGSLRSGAY